MQGDYCESYFALFSGNQSLKEVHSVIWFLQQHAKMKSTQYIAVYLFEKNLFISFWWAVLQPRSSLCFWK